MLFGNLRSTSKITDAKPCRVRQPKPDFKICSAHTSLMSRKHKDARLSSSDVWLCQARSVSRSNVLQHHCAGEFAAHRSEYHCLQRTIEVHLHCSTRDWVPCPEQSIGAISIDAGGTGREGCSAQVRVLPGPCAFCWRSHAGHACTCSGDARAAAILETEAATLQPAQTWKLQGMWFAKGCTMMMISGCRPLCG